jgi:hypothetical protein
MQPVTLLIHFTLLITSRAFGQSARLEGYLPFQLLVCCGSVGTMGTAGMPYGLQAMLKDGYKHMSGINEAVMKNLEACKELSKITRTSLGPNGAI